MYTYVPVHVIKHPLKHEVQNISSSNTIYGIQKGKKTETF